MGGILFHLQLLTSIKTILEKPVGSRDPWGKWHSSEAPPVILMKGHQELVSFTPCPRSLYDGWARLPGVSKCFTCTSLPHSTFAIDIFYSCRSKLSETDKKTPRYTTRCCARQRALLPAPAPHFLDKAQMFFLAEHLRFGFLCVLKSFMSIILLLKRATI